jgi:predicted ATPase/signal transduction histidine kinase/tRNA A-37 threonylcarbamoyl transferase component Bud32
MISLSSYQITEQLHESANSLVYRGCRQEDRQSVILKMLKQAYPPPEEIARFKREYEVTRSFDQAGIVKAYSLENDHNCWVMVLEDFGGQSLDLLQLAGKFPLTDFLTLAIQITDILGQIHQRYIIHKDINPSNIVFKGKTGQVKVIDFGISTVLSRESLTFRNPNLLEGTLAYISPEQTGRMNRTIDYRTDFYSLGVTFYELLTGHLPFPTSDALELVHCHIAKQPAPPHEHKPEIPPVISEIVLKLMAKNAEDRYQSAHGLKADLEECLRQLQDRADLTPPAPLPYKGMGEPDPPLLAGEGQGERSTKRYQIDPFPLGQHDISDRFQIPQKLYGREQEIDTLMAAFERVSQGASEMMLVFGYSGIGKSALVQEVYKPLTCQRGYFIAGKFDQFQRNIPYASLIQAFRSLVRQLLTESEAAIATWRETLLAALRSNAQVIIEVIPEVELIIGSQPALPDLPPAEAQNRFNLVFQNFIKVFIRPEHPLCIFLDDLQWADGASLKLIELLMTAADSEYLFLIGAYRDNEVSQAHPLMLTLSEIKKAKAIVNEISLSPLTLPCVTQLISDIFHCKLATTLPLAELVLTKTGGNPFFVTEFLKSLYAEALVTFNYPSQSPLAKEGSNGGWQWNLGQIQAQQITDNVVELMAGKVQKLPPQTQAVVKLAACVGNQFDLETLAIVYEKSPRETATALWPAIAEGFILPLSNAYQLMELDVTGLWDRLSAEYKFAHDRIQQAAYSLIPEVAKQGVHLRVGQLLLRNTPLDEQERKLFDIVNQLNFGWTLIDQPREREKLAQLNLQAGKKAKDSAAYQPGFNYLQIGIKLLEEESWQTQYELTLELYVEAAEAAYLSGDFEVMAQLVGVVLQQAKTLLDKVKAYEVRIQAYAAQNKLLNALKIELEVLKFLDLVFPEQPSEEDIGRAMQETQSILAGRRIEDLINLPEMTDPYKLAAMQIMMMAFNAAYAIQGLFVLMVCQQVNLSIIYGNAIASAFTYANYGLILCGSGNIEAGYQFGQLAVHLAQRSNDKKIKARTYVLANFFTKHSKEHLRETLPPLLEAYQNAIDAGDFEFTANALTSYTPIAYLVGKNLEELERETRNYSQVIIQVKQETPLYWHEPFRQAVLNWRGQNENPCRLIGEAYDEEKIRPLRLAENDISALYNLYFNKLILSYRFEAFQEAVENAIQLENYLVNAAGSPLAPPFYFYGSLARLAIFPDTPEQEKEHILKKVATHQKELEKWAHHAPMNYLHKFYLVEAERDRILGNDADAREYYDKAIALAHENEYLNEEALAYELAGRFYLARDQNRLAHLYLQDAHYAYQRWGAIAKVKDLEARYPQFFTATSSRIKDSITTTSTTDSSSGEVLDLATVIKASQTLTSEIVLGKLLSKLMKIAIENAGAQKGFLILDNDRKWVIEAEGVVDKDEVNVMHSIPVDAVDSSTGIPLVSTAIINFVAHTQENVVLNDATHEGQYTRDPYIVATQPKSILCTPLLNQGKLSGILYLENNLTTGAFTSDRVETLKILSAQAAISIENSRLYEQLEDYSRTLEIKVDERTQELKEKNHELRATLKKLKATQDQIIAQEKLASLGALTAGIAHEIKNPLNFVNNFAELSAELTEELLEEIENQKDRLEPESKEYIEEILSDLEQNVKKINEHGKRADNIVRGMLMHSRGKSGERELTDLNALLAEYVNLAYHGMRAKDSSFNITLETHYDDSLGQVNIVPQNISRVFLNVINNACYAAHEKKKEIGEGFSPTLWVSTKNLGDRVEIRIRDNGNGIPQEDLGKIFNPFFTTKPTGQGTGLGLSISHDIIVQEHRGQIKVETEAGSYAEFIITLPKDTAEVRGT